MGLRRSEDLSEVEGAGKKPPSKYGYPSAMSGAQMRSLVEYLGLSRREVARLLEVHESSVHRWWSDLSKVPVGVVNQLQEMLDDSTRIEEQVLQELEKRGSARVPHSHEDLESSVARYGPIFYRVAAARALRVYDSRAVEPGRLLWTE